jgi:predicted metal-binding membrane protein
MRNIFELTKREQRIVILMVVILVALAFAKHFWQTNSQPVPAASTLTPAASPSLQSPKEEPEPDDQL